MVWFGSVATATLDAHLVRLKSGVRLHCVEQGPAHGPAVLLLHGLSDSWFSFSRVLPLMPPDVRVLVPDQRGHGDSDRPLLGYSIDDLAADALDLLDARGIAWATVVGHSMGSFVARRIAERAPERVTRLVLVGSAPVAANAVLGELQHAVDALTDPVDPAFVRAFQLSALHRSVPPDFLEYVIGESRKLPARVWKAAVAALMAYRPATAPLPVPTVVIGGDQDSVFGVAEHEALARALPGAHLHIASDIGHAFHWEAPARFVSAMG